MYEEDDEALRKVAVRLRRSYLQHKEKQLGYKHRPQPRHNAIGEWAKVAQKVLEKGADPELWVSACFHFCQVRGGPWPHMMRGPKAAAWYDSLTSKDDAGETLYSRVVDNAFTAFEALRQSYMKTHGIPEDKVTAFLCKDGLTSTEPFVRVLMCDGDPDVLKEYGPRALDQVRSDPNIRKELLQKGYDLESFFQNIDD